MRLLDRDPLRCRAPAKFFDDGGCDVADQQLGHGKSMLSMIALFKRKARRQDAARRKGGDRLHFHEGTHLGRVRFPRRSGRAHTRCAPVRAAPAPDPKAHGATSTEYLS
jgi:hypothetical protein